MRLAMISTAALAAALGFGAPALGQGTVPECDGLSQPQAQALLDADPSDPSQLDPDGDGIACEEGGLAPPPAPPPTDAPEPTPTPDETPVPEPPAETTETPVPETTTEPGEAPGTSDPQPSAGASPDNETGTSAAGTGETDGPAEGGEPDRDDRQVEATPAGGVDAGGGAGSGPDSGLVLAGLASLLAAAVALALRGRHSG